MIKLKKTLLKLLSKFGLVILFAFAFRIIFAFWNWHPDVFNHLDWGTRFFEYMPSGMYAPESDVWNFTWPNQPPGTMLMFAGVRKLFEIVFEFFWQINLNISFFPSAIITFFEARLYPAMVQMPAIFTDFAIAYLIYKIVLEFKNKKAAKLASIIFLLTPIVWYNSSVWGQYDSVINLLFLLGIYLAYKQKIFLSILAIAFCLYIKISLIILLPIYVIYLIRNAKYLNIIKNSVFALIIILVITIPFSVDKNPLYWLYKLYIDKVLFQQLHLITANAFNFWGFARGIDWASNDMPLLGKTYEFWGYVLFGTISLPVYLKSFKTRNLATILLGLGLTYFTAWMFLTNMHERYLYPFFVFSLPAIIIFGKNLREYLALSLLNLMNMYYLWYVPKFVPLMAFVNTANKELISFFILVIFIRIYWSFIKSDFSKRT